MRSPVLLMLPLILQPEPTVALSFAAADLPWSRR